MSTNAKKYLFFIQTRDGKRIYAVKNTTDIIYTVDIFEEDLIKSDITIASGTIIEAMRYGIYIKKENKDTTIKKLINKTTVRVYSVKDTLPEPKQSNIC